MSSVTISRHFIDSRVESGRFDDASDVVRAGLRLLEDREGDPTLSLRDLRDRIRAGVNGGPGTPAAAVLDRLEQKYRRLVGRGDGG